MINIKFKRFKFSSIAIVGLIAISLPMAALAYGTTTYQKPYPGSNIEKPYGNEVSTNVDTSRDYMYHTNATKAIGYDFMYGSDKGLIEYLGEVSKEDHKNKKAKDYYYYPSDTVDGYKRHFADNKGFKEDASSVKDPRYKSLTVSHSAINVTAMVTALFTSLQKLCALILKIWISIANFDISTLLNSLNGASGFSKTLSTLFLINPDNGAPSPLFALSLGFFMFRFVGLVLSLLKGGSKGTAKTVFEEVGMMFAALVLAGLFSTANGPSSLASTATNITSKIGAEISAAGSPASGVFATVTGQANSDIVTTQSSQVTQIWINQVIQAQFGLSVNDLWIESPDGTSSFGDKTDVEQAINDTFAGEDPGIDGFKLSNGKDTINNIGYWYYAANSNTAISRNGKPFSPSGKTTDLQQNASAARTVLVVDFLANLRKIKEEKKDAAMVAKIDNIMNYLTSPSYGLLLGSAIVVMALYGIMVYALLAVGIFTFSGRVICSLGVYAVAIMPLMMLIKKTRKTAKGFMVSYLMAFVRYLSGSALFNLILAINVLLASNGLGGMFVAMAVSILLSKLSSHILMLINQQVTEMGRNLGENSTINRFNGVQLQRTYQDLLPGGRRTKELNKKIKGMLKKRDGESKGKKSLTDHVAEGFNSQQGFAKGFMDSVLGKRIDRDFEENLLYHENWDKDVEQMQDLQRQKQAERYSQSPAGRLKKKLAGSKVIKLGSKGNNNKFRLPKGAKGIGMGATKIALGAGGAYMMYKAASAQAGIDGATGLSKSAARILNSGKKVKLTTGYGARKLVTGKGSLNAGGNYNQYTVKQRGRYVGEDKEPATGSRVPIIRDSTPVIDEENEPLTRQGGQPNGNPQGEQNQQGNGNNIPTPTTEIPTTETPTTPTTPTRTSRSYQNADPNQQGTPGRRMVVRKGNGGVSGDPSNSQGNQTQQPTRREPEKEPSTGRNDNEKPIQRRPANESQDETHRVIERKPAVQPTNTEGTRNVQPTQAEPTQQPQATQPAQQSQQTQPRESSRKVTIQRKAPEQPVQQEVPGSRRPIVTDAMRAHGESIKTNIKMKAASKIPIVGEILADKISKDHDARVRAGKRISQRAAEIARETAVQSGGRRVVTHEEAIKQATQEMRDASRVVPTNQHSAKEIKRIEKMNRKAQKSIDKATKFVNRREVLNKMRGK